MDPVTAGLGLVDTFVNKFVKDKDLAAKLKAQAKSEEFAGELSLLVGQLEINKAEASHASVFVSGWRPFCGWYAEWRCCIHLSFHLSSTSGSMCLSWRWAI